ncbi:acetyl-CoA C-acetyltransferase [Nocardioides ginsengisegetis]|uniref:Probable acetyl-CoA acetyltransferase n=1 Tax=Nocardioides ginsengisegetis TaxID=661491 RepID=A0A7W3PAW7_9ACTN|nr:acetyl-CoA C-acetyltransferase [Nocardioides ginsengisegetis]
MPEAVICSPLRTAVGRYGGVLKDVSAASLGATVLTALVARTGLDPERIDDVVLGHCYPSSEAPAIGRVAALDAGFPIAVPGIQIDRRCGSGLQAVIYAAAMVESGQAQSVIAGGVESMSQVPYYSTTMRWGARGGEVPFHDGLARGRVSAGGHRYPVPGGMLETAENLRRDYGITREEQDEYSARSHARALAAQKNGLFDDEIVPVQIRGGTGDRSVVLDEHPRPGTTAESLAALRPVMARTDPDATVTAGNSSGQNDGAAACLVTTRANAEELGLRPLLRLVSSAVAGVPPKTMGIGPVPSTKLALERAGLTMADMDLIELNEAFAAQVLACTREWGFTAADFERLNVNGSGISLGHPVGATGVRILATLARELGRREARYGLETLCIGGGQGITAVFERLA